jgi:hypothetical protein
MKTALMVARLVLIGSGGLLLLLGLIIWTGSADALIPIHAAAGSLLVLSLWAIAFIAARNGLPTRVLGVIVLWSLAVVAFGLVQDRLLEGGWHWAAQVLHLVVSMSLVGIGQGLTIALQRRQRRLAIAAR